MDRDFYSIGHSTRTLDEFLGLLHASHIQCLVDVRSLPGSRAFPQFNSAALAASVRAVGIDYAYMQALGGRRGRSLPPTDERNAWWQNRSFRYYADYASTPPFAAALADLLELGARQRCAIMCAEAVWWRCHRRIITDHLLAYGCRVWHIMGPGKVVPGSLTTGARVHGSSVTYPAAGDPSAATE